MKKISISEQLSHLLLSTGDEPLGILTHENATVTDIDAAVAQFTQDALFKDMGADDKLTHENALSGAAILNAEKLFSNLPEVIKAELTHESSTGVKTKNAKVITRAYNAIPEKQSEFINEFFPIVPLTDSSVSHVTIEDNIPAYYTGNGLETIILTDLVRDPSFLVGEDNRLFPRYNDNNKDSLYAKKITTVTTSDYGTVTTAPILFGSDVSLLELSTDEGISSGNAPSDVRALAKNLKLERIYLDNDANNDKAAADVKKLAIEVSNITGNTFTPGTGNDAKIILSMDTTVKINVGDIVDGEDAKKSESGHKVLFEVYINATGQLDIGSLKTGVPQIAVKAIYDGNNKELGAADTLYATTKALVEDLEIRAFDIFAYEENSNLAVQGKLLTVVNGNCTYEIGYANPVSVVGSFASFDQGQASRKDIKVLARSISSTNLNTSAEGMKRLMSALEETKYAYENNTGSTLKGRGNTYLKPYYNNVDIALESAVSNMESKNIEASIQQTLRSALKKEILSCLRKSNFEAAKSIVSPDSKIQVVLGTDSTIAAFLTDEKSKTFAISPTIEVKVVTTPNVAMDGKAIGVFKSLDEEGRPDVLSFGICAWAPTTVFQSTKTQGKELKDVITAIPQVKHHVNANVMFELNITGLDELLNGK